MALIDDAVVDWFAERMKEKLAERSSDPGKGPLNWRQQTMEHMLIRHTMEDGELAETIWTFVGHQANNVSLKSAELIIQDIINEAVDSANTAMMIADIANELLERL